MAQEVNLLDPLGIAKAVRGQVNQMETQANLPPLGTLRVRRRQSITTGSIASVNTTKAILLGFKEVTHHDLRALS